jgi:hypothetical protein
MFHRVTKGVAMQISSYNYHGTPYERCSTPVAIERRQAYADWFRTFRWSWYITLTFSRDRTKRYADILLEQYFRDVEELIHAPLSSLIAPEEKQSGGVPPFGETDCNLTVCCLLKSAFCFHGSPSEWIAAGEAETGSGGDQPVKE